MYLAGKALQPYKEYVNTNPFSKSVLIYPIDSFPYPDSSVKIRLDFEFSMARPDLELFFEEGYLHPNIVDNMFDQMEFDLEEFIIFSDSENLSPYVYNFPFDGIIKRKTAPVEINLLAARTYREYKTMKDSVELTTFIRLDIRWEA